MHNQNFFWRISSIGFVLILLLAMVGTPEKVNGASPALFDLPGGSYVIRDGVPYLWLRAQPSSYANVITTIYPGQVFTANGAQAWDGVQWWAHVFLFPTGLSGWVEMSVIVPVSSVQPVTAPTTSSGAAAWNTSTRVRVSSSVPFVWLRTNPSSFAGVVDVALPGNPLFIASNSPQWDGTQWWWLVRRFGIGAAGWVEQGSLVAVSGSSVPFVPFRVRRSRRF